MKLGIQLINTDASVNSFKTLSQISIAQGETANVYFQLVDLDQGGLRYSTSNIATVFVELGRFPDVTGTLSNQRVIVDYSIRRAAAVAFGGSDRSIWMMPLTSADTANLMSTNMRVTVTEGASVKIALLQMAIYVQTSES